MTWTMVPVLVMFFAVSDLERLGGTSGLTVLRGAGRAFVLLGAGNALAVGFAFASLVARGVVLLGFGRFDLDFLAVGAGGGFREGLVGTSGNDWNYPSAICAVVISSNSVVIDACRILLYSRVKSLMSCFALSVAFFIATIRELCSEARA